MALRLALAAPVRLAANADCAVCWQRSSAVAFLLLRPQRPAHFANELPLIALPRKAGESGRAGLATFGQRREAATFATGEETDPYKVLSVPRNATADEIKAAYRRQALQWHPDRHPGVKRKDAERKFSAAANAYEVLSDLEARQQYDAGVGRGGFPGHASPGGSHSHESAERLFRQVFGSNSIEDLLSLVLGGDQTAGPRALRVGSEVRVLSGHASVLHACREAGIDSSNDASRVSSLGKHGKVTKLGPKGNTVMVSLPDVGDIWFATKIVRPVDSGSSGGASGGAVPGGSVRQEVVTQPDGSRVLRVTRISGRGVNLVFETPIR